MQLATEASVRDTLDRSKKLVKGTLKDIAFQHIDGQAEALTENVGDNQVDYRFFIGFKLLLNDAEVTAKSIFKDMSLGIRDFFSEFNTTFAGDFFTMNNAEVERYAKSAKFLAEKNWPPVQSPPARQERLRLPTRTPLRHDWARLRRL